MQESVPAFSQSRSKSSSEVKKSVSRKRELFVNSAHLSRVQTRQSVKDVFNNIEGFFRQLLEKPEAFARFFLFVLGFPWLLDFRKVLRALGRMIDQLSIARTLTRQHLEVMQWRTAIGTGQLVTRLSRENKSCARATIAASDDFLRISQTGLASMILRCI